MHQATKSPQVQGALLRQKITILVFRYPDRPNIFVTTLTFFQTFKTIFTTIYYKNEILV